MTTSTSYPRPADERPRESGRGMAVLFFACFAKAIVPGFINFAQQPHPLPGMATTYDFTPLAGRASSLLSVVLIVVCLCLIATHSHGRITFRAWLLVALAFWTFARTTTTTFEAQGFTALALVALVVLTTAMLQPCVRDFRVFGIGAAILSTGSLLLATARPANAQFLINEFGGEGTKAFIGDYVLAGPMTHSNTLGIFVALGLPFVGLVDSTRWRRICWVLCLTVVVMSASRTAILAIVAWLLFRLVERMIREFRGRFFRLVFLLLALGTAASLPLIFTDPDALSTRVRIWQVGLTAWESSGAYLTGLGPDWAVGDLSSSHPRSTSAHNLIVEWLVCGGLSLLFLGLVVLAVAAIRAVHLDRLQSRPTCTSYMLVLLVISSSEFVLPLTVSSQLFPVTGLVLAALLSARNDQPGMPIERGHTTSRKSQSHMSQGVSLSQARRGRRMRR